MYGFDHERRDQNIEKFLKLLDLWNSREKMSAVFQGYETETIQCKGSRPDPEIIIMNEPTTNLDPEASATVRDILMDMKKESKAILVNTHNLDKANRICNRIALLRTSIIAIDSPSELEKKFSAGKINIELDEIPVSLKDKLHDNNFRIIEITGNTISVQMKDIHEDMQVVIDIVGSTGARIKSIKDDAGSLEGVYLKIMRGSENGP